MECVKEAVCSCNECLLSSIETYTGIIIFLIGVSIILMVATIILVTEIKEVWE